MQINFDAFDPVLTLPNGSLLHLGGPIQAGIAVLAVLSAGFLLIRVTRMFLRGVVRAVISREHMGAVAVELSAAELKKREDTIDGLVAGVIRFFVVVIVGMMVLQRIFSVDIAPAIAGLGVAGIAIGLGTQSLVRDYLNGALILLENQYAVGDTVTVAGMSGVVEDFTLRHTKLRDLDGTVHTIPNGLIEIASNFTRTWARVHERIRVVYGTDVAKARAVVDAVGAGLAADAAYAEQILEAPRVERIDELHERGIVLLVLGKVAAASQWSIAGEFRHRVLVAFAENGIEMPQAMVLAGPNTPVAVPISTSH